MTDVFGNELFRDYIFDHKSSIWDHIQISFSKMIIYKKKGKYDLISKFNKKGKRTIYFTNLIK